MAAVDEDFTRSDPGPGEDFELQFLGQVAKIEIFAVCQYGVSFLEDPGGKRLPIGAVQSAEAVVEQGKETAFIYPGARHEQSLVEASKAGPLTDKVRGDFREVATEKRFSQSDGLQKSEAKSLRDGGRNEMGGMGKPAGVGGVCSTGGS